MNIFLWNKCYLDNQSFSDNVCGVFGVKCFSRWLTRESHVNLNLPTFISIAFFLSIEIHVKNKSKQKKSKGRKKERRREKKKKILNCLKVILMVILKKY